MDEGIWELINNYTPEDLLKYRLGFTVKLLEDKLTGNRYNDFVEENEEEIKENFITGLQNGYKVAALLSLNDFAIVTFLISKDLINETKHKFEGVQTTQEQDLLKEMYSKEKVDDNINNLFKELDKPKKDGE